MREPEIEINSSGRKLPGGHRPSEIVNLADFLDGANTVIGKALQTLEDFHAGRREFGDASIKRNKTMVSAADKAVAMEIKTLLSERFPDFDNHI